MEIRNRSAIADPGAELVDQLTSFWQRNRWIVVGGLIALVVVGGGTMLTFRARAAQEDQAAGKLAEASLLFWQGDYPRALQSARQVSTQFGSTPSGVDAHRVAGDAAFWTGDFKGAIREYQLYLDHVRTGILANAARRSLAYALESDRQFAPAAATYDQLVGVFDRESSAEFLMGAARCEQQLGQAPEAIRRLQRLLDEFGETSLAGQARLMIGEVGAH